MTSSRHQPRGLAARRSLLRAAWTAPVVVAVAAAPAYATTGCVDATISWSAFAPGTTITTASAGGVTMTLGLTDVVGAYGGSSVIPGNAKVWDQMLGAVATSLGFSLNSGVPGARETINFTFDRPIRDLTMTWLDIDRGPANGYVERISVLTPGYSASNIGADVSRSGDDFTGIRGAANTGTTGNVTLAWPGPLTSAAVQFSSLVQAGPSGIGLSDISFKVC